MKCFICRGGTPFADGSKENIYKKITAGTYYIPGYMSKELYSLVRHLLQSDPTRRYGNLRGRIDDIRSVTFSKFYC